VVPVGGRKLILGDGLATIDQKGRVAIPPALRNAIMANNSASAGEGDDGRRFLLGRHPTSQALIGYDEARLEKTNEMFRAREEAGEAPDGGLYDIAGRSKLFPNVEPVPFDTSGRFILSPKMRHRGGLTDLAYFYGLGDFFLIWNPHTLIADPNVDDGVKEDARWALKEKGLA
jgi:MraZ protein